MMGVPVEDPLGVTQDAKMPFLAAALDPAIAGREIERCCPQLAGEGGHLHLRSIRVVRYKPGRRCLIEYELESGGRESGRVTLLGKARARGLDRGSYDLALALWRAGFDAESAEGISLPEPMGLVPPFRMWLQRKVPGVTAASMLTGAGGEWLARRIAEAAHRLHGLGLPTGRRHTMADELRILHERLAAVAEAEPRWAGRIERLLAACDRLGASVPAPAARGIHRDFYPDQVIVDGSRLYLIDFDLYCEGDPGLDIGNFVAHLTEQSLRSCGDPGALTPLERVMEERFVELTGEATRAAVRAYAALTLVRHIAISTLFPERRPFTGRLLELSEERVCLVSAGTCANSTVNKGGDRDGETGTEGE